MGILKIIFLTYMLISTVCIAIWVYANPGYLRRGSYKTLEFFEETSFGQSLVVPGILVYAVLFVSKAYSWVKEIFL